MNAADYKRLDFELLAGFPFTPPSGPDPKKPDATPFSTLGQIPAAIKVLDGQKVIITGFMVPIDYDHGLVTEFDLCRTNPPDKIGPTGNSLGVHVRIAKGTKFTMEVPVICTGTFHVQFELEKGWRANIYQLDAETITADSTALLNLEPTMINGYALLGFDRLAGFLYIAGTDKLLPTVDLQIPEAIQKLDGKKVEITGTMLPMKTDWVGDRQLVTDFYFLGPKILAFGIEPGAGPLPSLNDFVDVRIAKGAEKRMGVSVSCFGILHILKPVDKNGQPQPIYQLDADSVAVAEKKP